MNKLFVFGCSFTQGSGCLPGEPYVIRYKKSEDDLIWPEIIAKKMNLELINFGQNGRANGRILDIIIQNFDLIQEGDIVIIQKTFSHRFEAAPINSTLDSELFTITGGSYESLCKEGYSKDEAKVLVMASVINDNLGFKGKTNRIFNFIKKIFINKGVKECIIFDLDEYYNKYEIIQNVDSSIKDAHWSYTGHRMFAEEILNILNKN